MEYVIALLLVVVAVQLGMALNKLSDLNETVVSAAGHRLA